MINYKQTISRDELYGMFKYMSQVLNLEFITTEKYKDHFSLTYKEGAFLFYIRFDEDKYWIDYQLGQICDYTNQILIFKIDANKFSKEFDTKIARFFGEKEINLLILRLLAAQRTKDMYLFITKLCIKANDLMATDFLLMNEGTCITDVNEVLNSKCSFSENLVFETLIKKIFKNSQGLNVLFNKKGQFPNLKDTMIKCVEEELKIER